MGKVVNCDGLWTSLQVNLWNTQRSDSPIPDKLRIFEDCCTVLDLTFSVLEDSQAVDWRAPEFGSLSNHFESFITHCFQGAFMGRATSFRVGIIKARFCKVLLAQFWDDIDREGTVSFRSQWDVASLARLICHLGLQDKEDAGFWDSYVNGGHIGTDFTAKALGMIELTARDGPLLIFCQLVHLAATAVPLNQSGLEPKDIEKVWELQKKAIESRRLPLNRASDMVWNALGQLRELVIELRGKNVGKDRKILERLLRMIDKVFHLRSSCSMDPSEGEPVEGRLSFSSGSTAVNRGPSSDTQTSEGEDGFGRAHPLFIPRAYTDLRPDSASGSFPSLHSTVQVTPGVGIVHRSLGTFLSTIPPVIPGPHFQYMGASQRRVYTSTRRTSSTSSVTRPNVVTRASTSALYTTCGDSPTVLQSPVITSSNISSDLNDEGLLLCTSPTFEEDEEELNPRN